MSRLSRLVAGLVICGATMAAPTLTDGVHAADASVYVVRAGDSLGAIAARLHVTLADLLRANNLTVSSLILPGQRLTVPGAGGGGTSAPAGGTTYTVKPGDWLSRIASRNGVTLTALLNANRLTVNSLIVPGQRLIIPGPAGGGGGGGGSVGAGGPSAPAGGTTYTVKAGDWLSRIASRNGVTLRALLDANRLTVNSLIVPGQQLRIPGTGGGGSPTQPPTAPSPAPPPAAGPTYTVRPGDSLGAIATQHRVELGALLAVNGLTRSSLITPNMQIKLPAGARLTSVDRVLNYALAQLGKPYRFWSRGPEFFDCSGLTVAAYAQIGVSLVHYSAAQALQGTAVDFKTEPIRAGDLVFQDTDGDGVINHVGIALNDAMWVQARSTRGAVTYGAMPADSKIVAVRRFIPAN